MRRLLLDSLAIWGLQLIPREPLDRIQVIDSWLVPGLVLGMVVSQRPLLPGGHPLACRPSKLDDATVQGSWARLC